MSDSKLNNPSYGDTCTTTHVTCVEVDVIRPFGAVCFCATATHVARVISREDLCIVALKARRLRPFRSLGGGGNDVPFCIRGIGRCALGASRYSFTLNERRFYKSADEADCKTLRIGNQDSVF